MGVAIAVSDRRATGGIRDQAAIDPVAVRVIGDDEHAFLGMRRGGTDKNARNGRSRRDDTQWYPRNTRRR